MNILWENTTIWVDLIAALHKVLCRMNSKHGEQQ